MTSRLWVGCWIVMIGIVTAACAGGEEADQVDADPRLVGDVQPTPVDLAGNATSTEIASVLDFYAGAGGLPACDGFETGSSRDAEVVPGVGVIAGIDPLTLTSTTEAAVGFQVDVCLDGWSPSVEGELRLPGGDVMAVPAAGESVSTSGVELHHHDLWNPEDAISWQIATYPGAPTGTYELTITDGARREVVQLEMETATERGRGSRHFVFDNYDEWFGSGGDLVVRERAAYGFVGFEPGETLDLLLYRSPRQDEVAFVPNGAYTLAATFNLGIDDRGEATMVLDADEQASGHCYVLDLANTLIGQYEAGGQIGISGGDPTAFCVP